MPLFQSLPAKPVRVAQNSLTAVGANSDAPKAPMFTVPVGRKFTVLGVQTDQHAAAVDLLATHTSGTGTVFVVDMPSLLIDQADFLVTVYEVCLGGESFAMGLRNGTAAPITPQLTVIYTDEPA